MGSKSFDYCLIGSARDSGVASSLLGCSDGRDRVFALGHPVRPQALNDTHPLALRRIEPNSQVGVAHEDRPWLCVRA